MLAEPAVPGAPEFDRHRLEILTQAKAEPLLLVDTPRFVDESDPGYGVRSFRQLILETEFSIDRDSFARHAEAVYQAGIARIGNKAFLVALVMLIGFVASIFYLSSRTSTAENPVSAD